MPFGFLIPTQALGHPVPNAFLFATLSLGNLSQIAVEFNPRFRGGLELMPSLFAPFLVARTIEPVAHVIPGHSQQAGGRRDVSPGPLQRHLQEPVNRRLQRKPGEVILQIEPV